MKCKHQAMVLSTVEALMRSLHAAIYRLMNKLFDVEPP